MKYLRLHVAVCTVVAIIFSCAAFTYAQKQPEKKKVKIMMRAGAEVTLFYGGKGNIKEEFPVGAVMGVYARNRAFGLNENVRLGAVEITGYGGETFVKAKVVEGKIGPGDVVKLKPGAGAGGMVAPPMD